MTGTKQPNVVDLVTDAVVDRFYKDTAAQIEKAVRQAQIDAQAQLNEFLHNLPNMPVQETQTDVKADARSRAGRTAIQGALATTVVAAIIAIAGVIGGGDFDFTSNDDWKAVLGAAIGAVVAAGAAYIQRIVNPPHVQENVEQG